MIDSFKGLSKNYFNLHACQLHYINTLFIWLFIVVFFPGLFSANSSLFKSVSWLLLMFIRQLYHSAIHSLTNFLCCMVSIQGIISAWIVVFPGEKKIRAEFRRSYIPLQEFCTEVRYITPNTATKKEEALTQNCAHKLRFLQSLQI